MNKLVLSLVFSALVAFCFMSAPAYAGSPYESKEDACAIAEISDPLICGHSNQNEEVELRKKIKNVLEVVYLWIGIITVIFIIIGGVKYMTSAGDSNKVESAKRTITYALVGLIVTLAAFAITEFFIRALEGRSTPGSSPTYVDPGSGDTEVAVKSISTVPKTSVIEGDSFQLKVRIVPDYATDHTLTFVSKNTQVATVSKTGKVQANAAGETDIIISSKNGVQAKVHVTVAKPVQAEGITLKPSSLTLRIGKTDTISATVKPADTADKTIKWSSSDPKVVRVSNSGKIKALKEGKATITAKTTNGKTGKAKVTVEPPLKKYKAEFKELSITHSGYKMDYFINVPEGATSEMPVILYLHGDGSFGQAHKGSLQNQPIAKHLRKSKKFISLIPIGKDGDYWTKAGARKSLKAMLDKTIKDYESDKKRIYIIGFSRGAIGTWNMIDHYPNFFAAAVPLSCPPQSDNDPKNFKNTPIYALIGGNDNAYNHKDDMRKFVKKVRDAGGRVRFTVINGVGHSDFDNWLGKSSHDPNYKTIIDDWMLSKHK